MTKRTMGAADTGRRRRFDESGMLEQFFTTDPGHFFARAAPTQSAVVARTLYFASQAVVTLGTWKLNRSPCTSLR